MPRALDELHHHHSQPLTHRAKRRPQRTRRLPFPRPPISNQQSFSLWHIDTQDKLFGRTFGGLNSPMIICGRTAEELWESYFFALRDVNHFHITIPRHSLKPTKVLGC